MHRERQSNIELLRIVAMLMVVLVHTNYFSLGEITASDVTTNPTISFWRILAEQICVVGVNVFVLISGWFRIRPTIKGACSILFQVFFYGLLICIIGHCVGYDARVQDVWRVFYFGGYYWFVIAYLGLYVISPVINSFMDNSSSGQQLRIIVSFFALEFIYGWVVDMGTYAKGYSTISFVGLYMLAQYLSKNRCSILSVSVSKCLAMYLIMTLVPTIAAFLGLKLVGRAFCPIFYSSPFVIAASVFLLLSFTKLSLKSKAINWIATSVFSIYLVHQHPVVVPVFISTMKHAYANMSGLLYVLFVIGVSLLIGAVCVVFDKVRIAIWNFLYEQGLDNFFGKVSSLTQRL